jgi:hypothetical protein
MYIKQAVHAEILYGKPYETIRYYMDLKCIYCGKEARYMFEGTSLCKDHLSKELKSKQQSCNTELTVINAPEVPE